MANYAAENSKVEKVLQGLEDYLLEHDMRVMLLGDEFYIEFENQTYKLVERYSWMPVTELPRSYDEEVLMTLDDDLLTE